VLVLALNASVLVEGEDIVAKLSQKKDRCKLRANREEEEEEEERERENEKEREREERRYLSSQKEPPSSLTAAPRTLLKKNSVCMPCFMALSVPSMSRRGGSGARKARPLSLPLFLMILYTTLVWARTPLIAMPLRELW